MVVSDEEKAPGGGRQVGSGKANVSESLLKCRNPFRWHRNRGVGTAAGYSLADDQSAGQVVPGMETARAQTAATAWNKRNHLPGAGGGGPARSSDEAPVMGVEQRGRPIRAVMVLPTVTAVDVGGGAWV